MSLFDSASLCITPNGYKEDKLYSIKPTDGSGDLVVTRATTATRVNSAGLIEQVPYNLLSYSQEFDNAYWTKLLSTITTNAATAPDGTTTADKLVEDTSNGVHRCGVVSAAGLNGTFSFYAKSGERTKIAILSTIIDLGFDLSNGTLINIGSGTSGGSIESVGNGWYRCSLYQAVNIQALYFGLLDNSGNISYTGNGTSGAYFWGAQLVSGSSAKEYFPTTDRLNVPRLDYTNSSCPSILVEPQRTNTLLYSEQFNNANWNKETGNSITANSTISPSGILDADTLTATSGNGINCYQVTPSLLTGVYTYSAYVKSNGTNLIDLYVFAVGIGFGSRGQINFSAGTFTVSLGTGTIENAGNGWYRVTLTNTYNAVLSCGFLTDSTTGTRSVNIWGAQLEAGSYATSYIPTVASAVTRNADVISKTGISSLIGQSQGTVFLDFVARGGNVAHEILGITLTGGGAEYIALYSVTTGGLYFISNVTGPILIDANSFDKRFKVAYSFISGNHLLYVNGTQISSSASGTVYSLLNAIYLGVNALGGGVELLKTNSLQLYKTKLSTTELTQLTTI